MRGLGRGSGGRYSGEGIDPSTSRNNQQMKYLYKNSSNIRSTESVNIPLETLLSLYWHRCALMRTSDGS